MLKLMKSRATVFAFVAAFALSACSSEDSSQNAFADEDSIMRYVPADTPYLVATGRPMPDELLDEIEPEIEQMMGAYRFLIEAALNDAVRETEAPMTDEQVEVLSAILNEMTALVSVEGMRDAGFERDSRMAFFGHGLLPVLRVEVSDAQKFEDMITRIEEAAGEAMNVGEIDGNSYRYAGGEAGNLIVGTFDGNAVFTFHPAMLGDDELRQLVGLTLPEQSIVETTKLTDIAEKYGYTDHYVGLVDVMQLVSIFIDEPSGLNAPLMAAFEYDPSFLSDVCRAEIREVAGVMPRMVFGYDTIGVEKISGSAVIELREDIATGLSAIAAAVPGLGTDPGGLFSMGMSGDLGATREFIEARLNALEADPYECEFMADMQEAADQMRAALSTPLPPVAYSFRGFNMIVDDVEGLDLASGQTPAPDSVDASFVVAMQDAQAMVAMGAMFSPELASLNLEADGTAVSLALPQLEQMGITAFAAMVDDGVAVAMGDNAEERVTERLNAASTEPPPVLSISMDAGKYYELIGQSMMLDQSENEEFPLAAREAVADMMMAVGDIYDRLLVDVRFTPNGVELVSTVTIAR